MKKKQLVPDKPGWWWRKDNGGWGMTDVILGPYGLQYNAFVLSDGLWGGPVQPPKWTPKVNTAKVKP